MLKLVLNFQTIIFYSDVYNIKIFIWIKILLTVDFTLSAHLKIKKPFYLDDKYDIVEYMRVELNYILINITQIKTTPIYEYLNRF